MAGFGFDAGTIAAEGKKGDMYLVVQVVLTEKFIGTKGYRLHTISTTSSGSKGFLGGDKIQATMVFEKVL